MISRIKNSEQEFVQSKNMKFTKSFFKLYLQILEQQQYASYFYF